MKNYSSFLKANYVFYLQMLVILFFVIASGLLSQYKLIDISTQTLVTISFFTSSIVFSYYYFFHWKKPVNAKRVKLALMAQEYTKLTIPSLVLMVLAMISIFIAQKLSNFPEIVISWLRLSLMLTLFYMMISALLGLIYSLRYRIFDYRTSNKRLLKLVFHILILVFFVLIFESVLDKKTNTLIHVITFSLVASLALFFLNLKIVKKTRYLFYKTLEYVWLLSLTLIIVLITKHFEPQSNTLPDTSNIDPIQDFTMGLFLPLIIGLLVNSLLIALNSNAPQKIKKEKTATQKHSISNDVYCLIFILPKIILFHFFDCFYDLSKKSNH